MLTESGGERDAGAALEREAPDLGLSWVMTAGEDDVVAPEIQFNETFIDKIGGREGANKVARRLAEFDLPGAATFGGPQERIGPRKPARKAPTFVKIDPSWVGLAQQLTGRAGGDIGAE